MSAFEIAITPPRIQINAARSESRQPTAVVMAPFTAKAVVEFEDVPIKKSAKRLLKIINTSADDIKVKITKSINPDYNITTDWSENVVLANNELEMVMVWSPVCEVACKETMQLTDNRNFRKDVMIILKSIANRTTLKTTRKFPTVSSGIGATHKKTLRLKSPKGAANKGSQTTKPTIQTQQRIRLFAQMEKPSLKRVVNSSTMVDKGNIVSSSRPPMYSNALKQQQQQQKQQLEKEQQSQYRRIKLFDVSTPIDRKSFAVRNVSVSDLEEQKENVSPLTPHNVLNMIDNLKFTPVRSEKSKKTYLDVDDLVNYPTPVDIMRNSRPRRITNTELTVDYGVEEVLDETKITSSEVLTNKTFDVKPTESLESSNDGSFVEGHLSFGGGGCGAGVGSTMIINKTTTIIATPHGRHLEIIQEEEDAESLSSYSSAAVVDTLQKALQNQSHNENDNSIDIKRDIKLVGTPLRKYSESMKDLSLKSPSSKIPIQGSMPNLNDAQPLRSIEQNRYYNQTALLKPQQTAVAAPNQREAGSHSIICGHSQNKTLNDNSFSCDHINMVSQAEFMFNQNEILAQSSRFNLNESAVIGRDVSPVLRQYNKTIAREQTSPLSKVIKDSPKRSSHVLCFSDSPKKETKANNKASDKSAVINVSPPKRMRVDSDTSFQRLAPANASAARNKNWSATLPPKKYRLAQTLSLAQKTSKSPRKIQNETRIKLYDSDLYLTACINPDPFAATTTCDPFLASTMYLDEKAVERHQNDFKKWLNALVSIPAELEADCNANVDVGKLFNEVRNKALILAPTKEVNSTNYLTKLRWESLRRAAVELFLGEEMRVPCSKVAIYVSKNAIRIRSDRNLHLDVVMQRYILELLLYFNPLWLRLGLEVVYGEKIHLSSNSDIVGLSTFIINRLFRDKYLEQKYSKAYTLSQDYADHIKKFTLQKVFFLLLFLDKAKHKRIIRHNPCLFVNKSPYKETKEVLLKISSELLANVGDITRELRRLGYVLQHKQNFIDEFDYAFDNLAVDLRDGIRLTRIMEIILLREDLTKQLRVPAISRLQRIFNVNLALRALQEADFVLKGNITAADIVDGHREKTLSLLWQIIYKFRSPKFHAAAQVLQQWWRKSWLRVVVRRRILHKEEQRRIAAACKIQAAFRGYMARRYVGVYKEERTHAAVIVQKYMRRYLAQRRFYIAVLAAIHIQRWLRAVKLRRQCRAQFLQLRNNCVFLQRCMRRWRFSCQLEQAARVIGEIRAQARWRHEKALIIQRFMRSIAAHRKWQRTVQQVIQCERQKQLEYCSAARLQSFFRSVRLQRDFQFKRAAVRRIQLQWRNYKTMCQERERYLHTRHMIIQMQRRFRATLSMREQRHKYQQLRKATLILQRHFHAKQQMIVQRGRYLRLRECAIRVQRLRRATLLMRKQRTRYLQHRAVIVKAQRRVRASQRMKRDRAAFVGTRAAACCIQRRYRARLRMRHQLVAYAHLRLCTIRIQRKWRATRAARCARVAFITLQYYTMVLQQKYRARKVMRSQHAKYQRLRAAVVCVQRRYRAKLQQRQVRAAYVRQRNAALVIQRRYRAHKLMRFLRAKYCGQRSAVCCIQQYVRGYWRMRQQRADFKRIQRATVTLQRAFRARGAMLTARVQFERLKMAAICVQRRYRARRSMLQVREMYAQQRQLIIAVQRRYRARLLGRSVRRLYKIQRDSIICLQRRYRAIINMRNERKAYATKREHTIKLQRRIRAFLAMRKQRRAFEEQRLAACTLQSWWHAVLQRRQAQCDYQCMRQCCIGVQRRWRAMLAMRAQRKVYVWTRMLIIKLQRRLRATQKMREQRALYQRERAAATVLQRHYRARREMLQIRNQYLLIRSLIVCIQRRYRAHRIMLCVRSEFVQLRRTVVNLQQRWRGRRLMEATRDHFLLLRSGAVQFQAQARGFLARKRFEALLTPEMMELMRQKKAARVIQRYWRGYRVRQRWRNVRILQIRQNIQLLKESSSAINSISWKVQDAVHLLHGRFSAAEALHVLSRLERLSRTVPHLLMDHSDFISTFCYGIMAQTIRSEVDKQLVEHCSCIILNLARYNSTTANTFQEGGLTTIAQMLLRWCNKDCDTFNTLCTLIWIFAHCPHKRKIIRNFMTTPEAIFVLRETKKLVLRKEKMMQNVRHQTRKMRWQQELQRFSPRALPSSEPDYGVVHKKPYIFISSVFAFDVVLHKLGIDVNELENIR